MDPEARPKIQNYSFTGIPLLGSGGERLPFGVCLFVCLLRIQCWVCLCQSLTGFTNVWTKFSISSSALDFHICEATGKLRTSVTGGWHVPSSVHSEQVQTLLGSRWEWAVCSWIQACCWPCPGHNMEGTALAPTHCYWWHLSIFFFFFCSKLLFK